MENASVNGYPTVLRTRRLVLRRWKESDLLPFARINADQRVMEFMLGTVTEEETRQSVEHMKKHFDAHGFGRWAVEITDSEKFIGFVGVSIPTYTLPFSPCVEVAWRICADEWGKGYAPEAASEAMRDGFERVGLEEIVSFTTLTNSKSRRVMEKLGMRYCSAEDFDHPMVPEAHSLRRHVLYRMTKADWGPRSQAAGKEQRRFLTEVNERLRSAFYQTSLRDLLERQAKPSEISLSERN